MSSFEGEAKQLQDAGWQQCASFYPNAEIGSTLGLPEGAIFLVLTQSCSVVSAPLHRDPTVELIVATKNTAKFNPRSPEAKGANARRFLVELQENGKAIPYLLDIYQRYTFPREKLLTFAPDGPSCSREDSVRIANWVARFYNRSALPTELVLRLKAGDFQAKVGDVLMSNFQGSPLHEQVEIIYGNWDPDDEDGPYNFQLDILVRSIDAQDFAIEVFKAVFELPNPVIHIDGIAGVTIDIEVFEYGQVTLADLDNRRRITEWDLLSGLLDEN
ncbi:hypothetical protein [Rhizobium sp. AG207R]|uniref:hypothetical protein n=1 Tax=Rhizobium sp. AG207R TaxID=2802287 RepID=UPI0022AC51AB|nr:hypothetical protein [Rhizobium sp. AG207R]MCZ3380390.1 hypothetical protein [Rhizobium sp. AG207R]